MTPTRSLRSDFTFDQLLLDDGDIAVVALWDTGRGVSITNDVEAVVMWLKGTLAGFTPETRVVYFDTDGYWDEIRHDGRMFTEFRLLRTRDRNAALGFVGWDYATRKLTERVGP